MYQQLVDEIESWMQDLFSQKNASDDVNEKRHAAVAYTDLEKVKAYIQTYLVKESES